MPLDHDICGLIETLQEPGLLTIRKLQRGPPAYRVALEFARNPFA